MNSTRHTAHSYTFEEEEYLNQSANAVANETLIPSDSTKPFQLYSPTGSNYGIWKRTNMTLLEHGIDALLEYPTLFPVDASAKGQTVVVLWGAIYHKFKELYEADTSHNVLPSFVQEPSKKSLGRVELAMGKDAFIGILDCQHQDRFSEKSFEVSVSKVKLATLLDRILDSDLEENMVTACRTIYLHKTSASTNESQKCKLSWIPGIEGRKPGYVTLDIGSGTIKAVKNFTGEQVAVIKCSPTMGKDEIKTAVDNLIGQLDCNFVQGGYATGLWRENLKSFQILKMAFFKYEINEVFILEHTKEALYGSQSALLAIAPYAVGYDRILSVETGRGSTQVVEYTRMTLSDILEETNSEISYE